LTDSETIGRKREL